MRRPSASLVFVWAGYAAGCGGASPNVTDGTTSSASTGGAIATAAVAGILWAGGGGCRLQGCPYGTYCDQKSGFCEVKKCSEGCPSGTVCNEGLDRCQMPGPPNTPNDRLPQDDKIRNPPGVH
ncbi:MAG: hypothetical protein ABW252_25285 [Polyangiales bacterium]